MKMLSKSTIEALWAEFDVPITHFDEIDESFCGWEARVATRDEIWRWFDAQYAEWGGVYALVYPGESEYLCPKCGKQLSPSTVDGYPLECRYCDENFFKFEAIKKED